MGIDDSDIVLKGRLGPGMMISADLETGEVFDQRQLCGLYQSWGVFRSGSQLYR